MAVRALAAGVACALLIGWSSLAHAQTTAQELLWNCERPTAESTNKQRMQFALCIRYLEGASDMLTLVMSFTAPGRYCPPEQGISNDQASRVVVKWIKEHPEEMHETARIAIFSALMQVFRCVPDSPPPPEKQRPRARPL